jgi:hypothetical protein
VIGKKIEGYSLSRQHPKGLHKARLFASVLGITEENPQLLIQAVLAAAAESDEAREMGDDGFGMKYELPFRLRTASGSALVKSGWIIRKGEDFPRLTSCYIVSAP